MVGAPPDRGVWGCLATELAIPLPQALPSPKVINKGTVRNEEL